MSALLHVLVVDSSDEERKVTVDLLKNEYFQVSNATSVTDARDVLRRFNSRNELDSIRVVVLESDLYEEDPIQDLLPINYLAARVKVILFNKNRLNSQRIREAEHRGTLLILDKKSSPERLVLAIKELAIL